MFIRTERLFLRPGWPEDWNELHSRIADEGIVRNLARAPWPYRPEDAQAFAATAQSPRHPHFLVTLPGADGSRLVGAAGLGRIGDQTELGYWIARDAWGQGYATEAARAVLTLARTLGHRRIVAQHFIDNPASGRVLRKVGFCPTGEIVHRHSCGRGTDSAAAIHAIDLGQPSDCDDDGSTMARRAA
ncbi:GNAT family N-acetyltransferase [Novosphingobium flavum]|uniref:GNAT family N-acetyltransferase n=1 Tax=Novosphingobium flavum TaxID=1778672 RepID=A0A7X1FRX0_9SPHN|nr:GNAT family N-acetyltransferase [Novosphingobium flavum]MBC2665813.1 GNAT family N-acetyltransferase [Novosphingobium flavum]